jgi:hypothetical protein
MSTWSRAPADVKRAITTWRLAADARRAQRIRDTQPVTRAEMIADIRSGFATADMIARDIHDCRATRRPDPIRWSIDALKEADKLSMLRAQIVELDRLLGDLGADTSRAVMS